jgi:hypothetical protein
MNLPRASLARYAAAALLVVIASVTAQAQRSTVASLPASGISAWPSITVRWRTPCRHVSWYSVRTGRFRQDDR